MDIIIVLLVLSGAVFWFLRFFWVLASRSAHIKANFLGEEAATALEFTLVFPLFLVIIMIIWQLLLLMNAAQLVSAAAFSAARSAIVMIPMQLGREGPNQLLGEESSEKRRVITQAAAVTCIPISPPITDWVKSAGFLGGVGSLTGGLSGFSFVWVGLAKSAGLPNPGRLAQKALYAGQFTSVDISGDAQGRFAENGPVTVKVRHKFFLNVPYVNVLFSDNNLFARFGQGQYRRAFGWGVPQRTLTAEYTLLNEGAREIPSL